jgi:hypothetical protein
MPDSWSCLFYPTRQHSVPFSSRENHLKHGASWPPTMFWWWKGHDCLNVMDDDNTKWLIAYFQDRKMKLADLVRFCVQDFHLCWVGWWPLPFLIRFNILSLSKEHICTRLNWVPTKFGLPRNCNFKRGTCGLNVFIICLNDSSPLNLSYPIGKPIAGGWYRRSFLAVLGYLLDNIPISSPSPLIAAQNSVKPSEKLVNPPRTCRLAHFFHIFPMKNYPLIVMKNHHC